MKKYQITEKDIEAVLNYLKIFDPENATPEMAIELLEYMHATYHNMIHNDPAQLKKMYEDLQKQKKLTKKAIYPKI